MVNEEIGAPLVHAGLVECRGLGVLVGGEAGRGKTTTFLEAERRQQWSFLGPESLPIRYPWEEKCLTYLHPQQARLLRASLLVGHLSAGQAGLERLVRLVEAVPCFALQWAQDTVYQLDLLLRRAGL